jgi:hypothetical protein
MSTRNPSLTEAASHPSGQDSRHDRAGRRAGEASVVNSEGSAPFAWHSGPLDPPRRSRNGSTEAPSGAAVPLPGFRDALVPALAPSASAPACVWPVLALGLFALPRHARATALPVWTVGCHAGIEQAFAAIRERELRDPWAERAALHVLESPQPAAAWAPGRLWGALWPFWPLLDDWLQRPLVRVPDRRALSSESLALWTWWQGRSPAEFAPWRAETSGRLPRRARGGAEGTPSPWGGAP